MVVGVGGGGSAVCSGKTIGYGRRVFVTAASGFISHPEEKSDSYRISAIAVQFSPARVAFSSLSGKIASCHRRRLRNKPTTLSLQRFLLALTLTYYAMKGKGNSSADSSSSDIQCVQGSIPSEQKSIELQ